MTDTDQSPPEGARPLTVEGARAKGYGILCPFCFAALVENERGSAIWFFGDGAPSAEREGLAEHLRRLADWFDDPQRSPYIVCPGFMGEARPGKMLRQIARELQLK
jgi:hypothetical protein